MEESSEQQCVSFEESGSHKVFIWPNMNKIPITYQQHALAMFFLELYIIMLGQAYIPFYSCI